MDALEKIVREAAYDWIVGLECHGRGMVGLHSWWVRSAARTSHNGNSRKFVARSTSKARGRDEPQRRMVL